MQTQSSSMEWPEMKCIHAIHAGHLLLIWIGFAGCGQMHCEHTDQIERKLHKFRINGKLCAIRLIGEYDASVKWAKQIEIYNSNKNDEKCSEE